MIAKDFMTHKPIALSPNNSVAEAAKLMIEKDFSVVPIVDENFDLVGIVTESDFIGKEVEIPHALVSIKQLFGQSFYFRDIEDVYKQSKELPLSKIMTKRVISISAEAPLSSVVQTLLTKNLKKLPVTEGKKLIGVITRKDIIKAFNHLNS